MDLQEKLAALRAMLIAAVSPREGEGLDSMQFEDRNAYLNHAATLSAEALKIASTKRV